MAWLSPRRAVVTYLPPPVVQLFVPTHPHQHLVLSDFTVFVNLLWNTISVGLPWGLLSLLIGLNLVSWHDYQPLGIPLLLKCLCIAIVLFFLLLLPSYYCWLAQFPYTFRLITSWSFRFCKYLLDCQQTPVTINFVMSLSTPRLPLFIIVNHQFISAF